jgi:type VI secretion system secreted protein Hcp
LRREHALQSPPGNRARTVGSSSGSQQEVDMPGSPIEIFLKLDGIDGGSTVRGHEKETIVLSYEQGIDHPAPPTVGGGGAVGRSTFSSVRFRKPIDVGSIPLLLACASGAHLREAHFTFRRPGGSAIDFYKVMLDDVLVTRLVQRAGSGAQYPLSFDDLTTGADTGGLLDEATLTFARIRWEYQPVRVDGSLGPAVKGGWDITSHRRL